MESLKNALSRANSLDDVLAVFDSFLMPVAKAVKEVIYGIANGKIGLAKAKKLKQEAYNNAMDILSRVGSDPAKLTEADRVELAKYSGVGGIGESTNEYYTPQFVAEAMWSAIGAMGFDGGAVLEPSAGVGVFGGTKPSKVAMTNIEADPTSAQINGLLHADDKTINSSFEKFASKTGEKFNAVVGNPPFGDRGNYGKDDKAYEGIKLADQYFVTRAIDLTADGGLICMALPPRIVDGKSLADWRKEISYKAEFLGAHLLPAGTFNQSGTSTTVCVAIWRKHDEQTIAELQNFGERDLTNAKVLFDEFINGSYFEKSGRKFVIGELQYKKGNFGSMETTAKGKIDQIEIKNALARKFDSRIDWSFLSLAEPEAEKFSDGDSRIINGRLKTLTDGHWIDTDTTGQRGQQLDKAMYGVESLDELRILANDPASFGHFSFDQLRNIEANFKAFLSDDGINMIRLVAGQKSKYRDRLVQGLAVGYKLEQWNNKKSHGYNDVALRDEILSLAQRNFEQFGDPNSIKALRGLTGKTSNYWNAFSQILDKNGDPSEAMQDIGIQKQETGGYNSKDPASIIKFLSSKHGQKVQFEDVAELYDGEPITKAGLISLGDIAFDQSGYFSPLNSYCSGNVVEKIKSLTTAIAKASSLEEQTPEIKAAVLKWQEQIEQMNARRDWQKFDEISFGLSTKWVDRAWIVDFLHDQGYTKFKIDDENEATADKVGIGYIQGYRFDDTGKDLATAAESFARQIENHINGRRVASNEKFRTAAIKAEIADLDARFRDWIQLNNKTADIEQKYNDTFNQNVAQSFDDGDLGLEGLTGHINLMGYQNEAIRRLASDGRGLLGFQMGLGKTFTALGLAEYKFQNGLSKRTCIVVPKSTLENWYHEHIDIYGRGSQASKNILFVGLEPVIGDDGKIKTVPVLDKEGNDTGRKRDVVRLLDGKEITANMHKIPQSNLKLVVMTKEQFARVPMRPETKESYVDNLVSNQTIRSHRLAIEAIEGGKADASLFKKSSYQEARKRAAQQRKYGNEGTGKSDAYPYFEDMAFDNVIVDEAHNYRNAYQAGRETAGLAWLPTSATAKQSLDMAIKCDHIRKNNNGTGTTMLSATPLVNSPSDMFNMLSLVIGNDEWLERYEIANVDDFIKTFGAVETRRVEKLSGEIEPRDALVGFQNLTGLRNIFHRWVDYKEAADVAANVEIPDLDYRGAEVAMSKEQSDIYFELRQKADWLSKASEAEVEESGLTVFGLIRQMDKISTDIDLYNGTITYLFEESDLDKVSKLEGLLPASIKISSADSDEVDIELLDKDEIERFEIKPEVKIDQAGGKVKFVVRQEFEAHVEKAIKKLGINENTITHPITPKYAQFIENLRAGLKDGNQIVFTEEKSQHEKLRRIISYHLNMSRSQIGIINADTVKQGKKQADLDAQQEGLEAIAADFNEGRLKVVIANKKAEVGINLHKNTYDVHLLTIPWQPASLKQKAGRAARVGSAAKSVRVWIYQSKGSFDKFRFEAMQRKSNWIDDIIKSKGTNYAENANADDAVFFNDLLAEDEEKRRQLRAERDQRAQEELLRQKRLRAKTALDGFLKQSEIIAVGKPSLQFQREKIEKALWQPRQAMKENGSMTKAYKKAAMEERNLLDQIRRIDKKIKDHDKATDAAKQWRGQVASAIEAGLLDVDPAVLDTPNEFAITGEGKSIRLGSVWWAYGDYNERERNAKTIKSDRNNDSDSHQRCIVQVKKHNIDGGFALCDWLYPTPRNRETTDPMNFVVYEDVVIYYENFDRETEFTMDDVALENVANSMYAGEMLQEADGTHTRYKSMVYSEAIKVIDRVGIDRFTAWARENRVMLVPRKFNYGNGSTDDQDGIYFVDGEFISASRYKVTAAMADKILLPPLSEPMREKLSVWAIDFIKQKARSDVMPLRPEIYISTVQMEHLLGRDWLDQIMAYSANSMPVEQIIKETESALTATFEKDGDEFWRACVKRRLYDSNGDVKAKIDLITAMKSRVTTEFMDKYRGMDNYNKIISTMNAVIEGDPRMDVYKAKFEATKAQIDADALKAKQEEARAQQVTLNEWIANNDSDEAMSRLERFFDAQSVESRIINTDPEILAMYGLGESDPLATLHLRIAADLYSAGVSGDPRDLPPENTVYLIKQRIEKLIETGLPKPEPEAPEVPEATEATVNDGQAAGSAAEIYEQVKGTYLADCVIKPCLTTVTVQDRRGRKGKYRYTAITLNAGEYIGVQDTGGYYGQLSKFMRGDNQKQYGAFFLNAEEGEFVGGWWMISAQTDLKQLAEQLAE